MKELPATGLHNPCPAIVGIELGSTRIKAVLMDSQYQILATGSSTWASRYENGIWTYDLEQAWAGLKDALRALWQQAGTGYTVLGAGVSAMMHGYLAFDKDWNLLVPFRTWQNTNTREASEELSQLLNYNIPQRWSVAHLYHAVRSAEPHVTKVAHITTLAGYIHHMLTGENVLCVDDASGVFPINAQGTDYDGQMLEKAQSLFDSYSMPWTLRQLLPEVRMAGEPAGTLTAAGEALLEGLLPAGIPMAPPAGDGGTGMVATNSVGVRTGNVSAGTSVFADIVLEKPLQGLYPEIDNVTTPTGLPVAEIHCNNGTADMNAWVSLLAETVALFYPSVPIDTLYTRLYEKSLEGQPDCGGVLTVNYQTGECITHLDAGYPLTLRLPGSSLTLANFLRAQLYATFATLRMGFDLLEKEQVRIDRIMGHGGVFKTPGVGQRYLAAACQTSVTCMDTAGEGGAYGMALLTAYLLQKDDGETLEDFLTHRVFAGAKTTTVEPMPEDVAGYARFLDGFSRCLKLENLAQTILKDRPSVS